MLARSEQEIGLKLAQPELEAILEQSLNVKLVKHVNI